MPYRQSDEKSKLSKPLPNGATVERFWRRKKSHEFMSTATYWKDARDQACVVLGVGPDELEEIEK